MDIRCKTATEWPDVIVEYGKSPCSSSQSSVKLMDNELHTEVWEKYCISGADRSFRIVQNNIQQFSIPVREGISCTEEYADVVKRGKDFDENIFGGEFYLEEPEKFRCVVYDHYAGNLPVLATESRTDFENLYRLIACRCEPEEVNPSVNALMVSGINNWQRLNSYRDKWMSDNNFLLTGKSWRDEFNRILKEDPSVFRDRLILVMKSTYSSVSAEDLGLGISNAEWLDKSMIIRLEHEFTHYALKRFFNVMRNHLWDEVIADFIGTVKAFNDFRGAWLITFLGISAGGEIKEKARFHHYTSKFKDRELDLLAELIQYVAAGLEKLYRRKLYKLKTSDILHELSGMSLVDMATVEGRY